MCIKKVKTEVFYNEYETRGSFPSRFFCDDSEIYIVKHHQQGNNYKHLINELVAAQLAKIVDVPVPDFALVEIRSGILPNDYRFALGKPSGLGFGSKFLEGTILNIPNVKTIIDLIKRKVEIIEDFVKICAFDIWLRNSDRSINNPNLIVQERKKKFSLFGIDHSSIFSELNYSDLASEIHEPPPVGEILVDQELFLFLNEKYGLFFNDLIKRICNSIKNIKEISIKEIIANVPNEWNLTKIQKEAIFYFINFRKNNVENNFNDLLNAIGL